MPLITSPDSPKLDILCEQLSQLASLADTQWPAKQLRLCAKAGVFRWFLPEKLGGLGWSEADIVRGYMRLAAACLTTTFVITQRMGAVSRIATSGNPFPREQLLAGLLSGETFATVGISHLTTSRQHLQKPVLAATETSGGIILDGYSPWVTGSPFADYFVLGATVVEASVADQRQVLVAVPRKTAGVEVPSAPTLVSLSASHTGEVRLHNVHLSAEWILVGPVPEVMKQGIGAKTGGLQTSALALGLSAAAIKLLEQETNRRPELLPIFTALASELATLHETILSLANDSPASPPCNATEMRVRANSLVLRCTQAALGAVKGAGFVSQHPAGRYASQALFFLVWSCPQGVLTENLCELAGL